MCGIVGIIQTNQQARPLAENIRRMTDVIAHRGPDDEGFLFADPQTVAVYGGESPVVADALPDYYPAEPITAAYALRSSLAFGFRRLAIIDLSPFGHQPMSYRNRYWIVFNGEIYNYLEIREELAAAGYAFQSQSDTEVILAAYAHWGADCLNRFNGMWAFAIYDRDRHELFLSRDRMGIKPLYYYNYNGLLIFGSEIKSILAHPDVETRPNTTYIDRFLREGVNEFQEETAFTHIYRFSRASWWRGNIAQIPAGRLAATTFWTVPVNPSTEPFDPQKADQYAQQYRALLRDAVRLRLRSDVPVGTAFSGGLDSSSIVHYIDELHRENQVTQKLKVFSTVYPSEGAKDCDESEFINLMAERYHLEAYGVEPQAAQVPEQMQKMVRAMENPQESTLMSYMFTYGLVRQNGVTVTLDGQGADELQAGYKFYITNHLANVPASALRQEYALFASMPGSRSFARLGAAFNILRQMGLATITRQALNRLGKLSDPFVTVNERLHRDYFNHMVTLLHYGDHSSMACSVEARYPFLDYRLAEFWHGMPGVYKVHEGWTKYVARLAMNGLLPDQITWRKDKMGWEIPQDYWFRGELKAWFCTTIENSAFLQSMGLGRDIRRQLDQPYTDHKRMKMMLRLLNLALWHHTFFPKQPMQTGDLTYVIVTPVRNEGEHIEATLQSVIAQTNKPRLWVIVDDQSTDRTPALLHQYAGRYPWIKVVSGPDLKRNDYSSRVVQLFNYGLSLVDVAYDVVVKLDGDVYFKPDFFAGILAEFRQNPRLGIASGHLTLNGVREKADTSAGNTRGATKCYRKACLADIGGVYPYTSWDTVDNAGARAKGWETRMLPYEFEHLKPEGSRAGSPLYNHYRTGLSNGRIPYVGAYFMAKALSKALEPPFLLAPLVQLYGYIQTRFIRKERPFPDFVTQQVRKEQKAYLLRRIKGKRLPPQTN
ncbi:hypothetical protein GCM10023187_13200 [Nibrella viscosa]|uniref:asparagine synthase (glutamine-hydrolyzing) n=1 Tax=Nibrella viscosa TaxID=1084524 RepID=A0ABP8K3X4_9BACT